MPVFGLELSMATHALADLSPFPRPKGSAQLGFEDFLRPTRGERCLADFDAAWTLVPGRAFL